MLKWIGTICGILGAFTLASAQHYPQFSLGLWAYTVFIISGIAWAVSSVKIRDWANLTQQGFFLAANLIGFLGAL